MTFVKDLRSKFHERFGAAATVCRAPGRVNIIGEHTDYNDGFVLPAAIDSYCWLAFAPRTDRKLIVHSENFGETAERDLDSLAPGALHRWSDYPLGVAWALEQSGYRLCGANLLISGEVPLGAGLSSSAAVEVAVATALAHCARLIFDRKEIALLCQRAENEYVGMRCGIMDQFVSCHGQTGHAILLDCRSLDYQVVPIPAGLQLVICNTMVKHQLGSSEYNVRRAQCEEGVRALSTVLHGIRALRNVSLDQLERHRNLLADIVYKRCRHVITENERTLKVAELFRAGKEEGLAELLAASHRSLRDDYQVSCPELDSMVEIASRQAGVHGSRMIGGGFGGCTVNLVEEACAREFQQQVAREYQRQTGSKPEIYLCKAEQGVEVLNGAESNAVNQGQE
jgi:galactokinase